MSENIRSNAWGDDVKTIQSATKYDLAWAVLVGAAIALAGILIAPANGGECPPGTQCGPGGCPTPWQVQPIQRQQTVVSTCVVPVYFGNYPTPASGIYVGTIRGRGVTITCWHAAKHGVRSVADAPVEFVMSDKFGYDMAAVITRPLSVSKAVISRVRTRIGQAVRIIGYPDGRIRARSARIIGWFAPEDGQEYGDVRFDVRASDGDSGGAVFDERGELIAMIWGTSAGGSVDCVGVSQPAIVDFLCRLETVFTAEDAATPDTVEPPAPLPIPDPEPVADPGPDQLSELRALIMQNAAAIAALADVAGLPGPQGPQGEPGRRGAMGLPGLPGSPGESATIDFATLSSEQIDALVARLPPVVLQTIKSDAKPETIAAMKKRIAEAKPGDVIMEDAGYLGGNPLRIVFVPLGSENK